MVESRRRVSPKSRSGHRIRRLSDGFCAQNGLLVVGWGLALVALEFEGDVLDAEVVGEHRPQRVTSLLRLVEHEVVLEHDVSRHGRRVGREAPHMEVVDVDDTR